jgi:hypothetical protein
LAEQAPEHLVAMVSARQFFAFRCSVGTNLVEVREWIQAQVPHLIPQMIAAHDYEALKLAVKYHYFVAREFLFVPEVFIYAEQHSEDYGHILHLFVNSTLRELRKEKEEAEKKNPQAVFDIRDNEKIKTFFHIARYLIRLHDEKANEQLQLILYIPSMRHAAAQQDNELLRLALTIQNQGAQTCLLAITEVERQARARSFYAAELQQQPNLSVLAENPESSMVSFTEAEEHCIKELRQQYQEEQKRLTVHGIMQMLRNTLRSRYSKEPATITVPKENGAATTIRLPMDWNDFEALALNPVQRLLALRAYYQNVNHSAWRYLQQPNPWIHPNADYVVINQNNPTEKWSTYATYQLLIALLFLGARDRLVPGIDDYTPQKRLYLFFNTLAYMARAHNWDHRRVVLNKDQQPALDVEGQLIYEDYDDQEADRPVCLPGAKRELFHALQGHPALNILTWDIVLLEIHLFVRAHFANKISGKEGILLGFIENYLNDEIEPDGYNLLLSLNIPPDESKCFSQMLFDKYPKHFATFQCRVDDLLSLTPDKPLSIINFYTAVESLLKSPRAGNRHSLFAQGGVESPEIKRQEIQNQV